MARKFFLVSAGILMFALAYHLGATSATAQAPSNPVVAAFGQAPVVVTANGDVYQGNGFNGAWTKASNVFGGPVPSQQSSFGALKARFR